MSKGRFIVIEGIDGSGKTTQAKKIVEWLTSLGISAWYTAEPTDGEHGRAIKGLISNDLSTEDKEQLRLLFRQDRIQHLFEEGVGIGPRLDQGQWVVCDRYIYSTFCYQGDMSQEFLEGEYHASNFVIQPDALIYISLDAETAHQRLLKRKEKLSMFETCTRLQCIRDNYWKLLRDPSNPLHMMDHIKAVMQIQGANTEYAQHNLIKNLLMHNFPELKDL